MTKKKTGKRSVDKIGKLELTRQVIAAEELVGSAVVAEEAGTITPKERIEAENLHEFLIAAIKGQEIGGERLNLSQRASYALKLLNKTVPDMKAIEVRKTEEHTVNVKYSATADLLDSVITDAVENGGEIIDVEPKDE